MRKPLVAVLIVLPATIFAFAGSSAAAPACDRVASPSGSDSSTGTASAPFQTAQKLADSLAPGQTGCLRAGVYTGGLRVNSGGAPGAPVTFTSFPGEVATITGRLYVPAGSNYVTFTGVHLDGTNSGTLPSPSINANYATFSYDDVTNYHSAICFVVGSSYGPADHTVLVANRIHDCGVLPANNHEHGIYVEAATNTRIAWNQIYDNADRGIQLYPDAQYTTIDHNVIDGNGEGLDFSGSGGIASNHATVYANIIANSKLRYDVSSWYPSGTPAGIANVLVGNCIGGGHLGAIDASAPGFTSVSNTIATPQYIDAANHNYQLATTSPCRALLGSTASVTLPALARAPTANHSPAHGRSHSGHHRRATHTHHRHRRHHNHRHHRRHHQRHHHRHHLHTA